MKIIIMDKISNPSVLLVLLTALVAGCGRHPTDASLKKSFQTNLLTLSNIVMELKMHPDIERIDWQNGTIIANNSETNPPALTAKLLPQLKLIGQELLITNARDGSQVRFYFSSRGLSVSGSSKGICYHEKIPDRIVQDTDASSHTNAPFTVFRPLQPNWFIFFSR